MTDNEYYWAVVHAVKSYIRDNNGRRPSITEISEMTGIPAVSNVLYHLTAAVRNGDLIDEGKPRQSRRWVYNWRKRREE
jgi:hypothetical protein